MPDVGTGNEREKGPETGDAGLPLGPPKKRAAPLGSAAASRTKDALLTIDGILDKSSPSAVTAVTIAINFGGVEYVRLQAGRRGCPK